jgi:DNA-binding MarR family transcriptional regulator
LARFLQFSYKISFDNYRYNEYISFVSPRSTARPASPSQAEATLFVSLMQLADKFGSQAEQLVKAAGLTAAQYNVLRILRGAGPDGLACGEIGERMISRDPDITRLLDRMEKQQLITRERQSDDRRVVKTCITTTGLQILKTLDQPIRDLHKKQFERLSPKQLQALATLLHDLIPQQNDCEGKRSSFSNSAVNKST